MFGQAAGTRSLNSLTTVIYSGSGNGNQCSRLEGETGIIWDKLLVQY